MDHGRRTAPRMGTTLSAHLIGAVLLGMTTLLVPKSDPREHWATPPRTQIAEVQEHPADPDEPLDAIDLALLLAGAGS